MMSLKLSIAQWGMSGLRQLCSLRCCAMLAEGMGGLDQSICAAVLPFQFNPLQSGTSASDPMLYGLQSEFSCRGYCQVHSAATALVDVTVPVGRDADLAAAVPPAQWPALTCALLPMSDAIALQAGPWHGLLVGAPP